MSEKGGKLPLPTLFLGMSVPRSLELPEEFPYRSAIASTLDAGATCRRDERRLIAGELTGTYEIRLRIALDQALNGGLARPDNWRADDLAATVKGLRADPACAVVVIYIHGRDGQRFVLFERADTGAYIGCLRNTGDADTLFDNAVRSGQ